MQAYKTLTTILLMLSAVAGAQLPDESPARHMGVATCAASQCHGSSVPRDGSAVMQNEYVTWTQDDPHSRAYEVLSNDLSRAIAARLGLDAAHTAGMCLDCHADNVGGERRGVRFQVSDGVGCESCHGAAENWLSTHYNAPTVTHSDNVDAGLYPTDDASARATLCLSCHLGTSGKFATHRMMAAGHPRLSFELDTFTELWRTAGRQPHYRVDVDYADRKSSPSHVYLWASGLLAEGRQRLALIMDDGVAGDSVFPELALYDCHACHRSMKSVQWRALPRHGGAGPGLPFINDGNFVMAVVLARALRTADADEIETALAALHRSGNQGRAETLAAAAALDRNLRALQSGLSESRLRNRQPEILEEMLSAGAEREFLDYASAEQAFMAVQMLAFELDDPELQEGLDKLAALLDDDERYRPAQFAALLRTYMAGG